MCQPFTYTSRGSLVRPFIPPCNFSLGSVLDLLSDFSSDKGYLSLFLKRAGCVHIIWDCCVSCQGCRAPPTMWYNKLHLWSIRVSANVKLDIFVLYPKFLMVSCCGMWSGTPQAPIHTLQIAQYFEAKTRTGSWTQEISWKDFYYFSSLCPLMEAKYWPHLQCVNEAQKGCQGL